MLSKQSGLTSVEISPATGNERLILKFGAFGTFCQEHGMVTDNAVTF